MASRARVSAVGAVVTLVVRAISCGGLPSPELAMNRIAPVDPSGAVADEPAKFEPAESEPAESEPVEVEMVELPSTSAPEETG